MEKQDRRLSQYRKVRRVISQERSSDFQIEMRAKHYKRSQSKKPMRMLLTICLILLVTSMMLSSIGYLVVRSHNDLTQAHTGAKELETGIALLKTLPHDPFNTTVVDEARQNFNNALIIFSGLNNDIAILPDAFTSAPIYGPRLHAAKHLLPLAVDVAQAGLASCSIISTLTSRLHNSPGKASGLTMPDMIVVNHNFQQIKLALAMAIEMVSQLQPGDLQLDPNLGKMIGEFRTYLPLIQQGMDQATALFSVLPVVLGIGKPANYLVEIMDSTELRPGGGFIGNYGIVTLGGGQVTSAKVIDTYLLDESSASKHHVPFPSAYSWFPFSVNWGWGLRDSNLDADFPTSARNGETLYKLEGGTLPLSGVIAITPKVMEQILTLTGPITVPEYNETVTSQNLIDRIHYHQLIEDSGGGNVPSADGYSSVRKHFTALLGQSVLERLHAMPASLLPKLFGVLITSLHTKDIQIYFNANAAEKLLQVNHIDDSIQPLERDGILVVDANITPNKANQYINTTVNDQVTIDQTGTATHRSIITFSWTKSGLTGSDFYGSTLYRGFVRVYVPAGGVLQTQDGWTPYSSGTAFGHTFWGGIFYVNYPLVGTITLTWKVAGAAQKNGSSWHYQYLIQQQAGALQNMNLQVAFPPCAKIAQRSAGVVVDSNRQAHLEQVLSQDTEVSINYTCS